MNDKKGAVMMEIVSYQKKYLKDFIDLNTAWIEKFFVMEQEDRDILYHAEEYLQKGGMIFFAVEEAQVLATCMIYPCGDDVWEICKLAADEKKQGHGAGTAVFQACMDYAEEHGAKKITLISNHILKPALHIYEKFGFKHVPLSRGSEYDRADVQCEYIPMPVGNSR